MTGKFLFEEGFSDDGQRLYTTSPHETRIWRTTDGQILMKPLNTMIPVLWLRFRATATVLFYYCHNDVLQMRDADMGRLLALKIIL